MKILKKKRPAIAIGVIVTTIEHLVSITMCLIAQFIRKIENGNINFSILVFNYIYTSI